MIALPPRARILIADDDPIAVKVLSLNLQKLGHEVVTTRDGVEAWERFDQEPIRIVISDWMMPGLDGLKLCDKVRNRPHTPYTYFILLTGAHTSPEDYALAMDSGVDDFLLKPFDPAMLRARIRVAERILSFATEIKQLKELIPICAYCHDVRDDNDYWQRVESYINSQTGSRFSHGICPKCFEKQMRELDALEGVADLPARAEGAGGRSGLQTKLGG